MGYKHTEQAKKRIGDASIGIKNHNWKGQNVGYRAVHSWVERQKGKPQECIDCGVTKEEKRLGWSNVDHTYQRNVDHYQARCVRCHKKYDKSL